MTYEQAFTDRQTLWSVGAAHDMTGAYVDQEDLELLLASPNKQTAKRCLLSQIGHWFTAGIDDGHSLGRSASSVLAEHPELHEIAERHGFGHLIPQEQ